MNLLKKIINLKSKNFDFDAYLKKINPEDIVIDCGANVGTITTQLAATGAKVYSFEPNPYAFAELKRNTELLNNVTLFNKGVWDRSTKIKLFLHKNAEDNPVYWSQGSSILVEKPNVNQENFVDIEVVDLIKFIQDLNHKVKFLKIDVEGAEYEILDKLIETGAYKLVDLIVAETHAHKIQNLIDKDKSIRAKIARNKIKNISLEWI